jgi:hypothetical protein
LNRLTKICLSLKWKFLFSWFRTDVAQPAAFEHCADGFRLLVKITPTSLFFSGGELVPSHKILMPGVVFANAHDLALSIVEGHSPFVRPLT